jgi:hypothetical protein
VILRAAVHLKTRDRVKVLEAVRAVLEGEGLVPSKKSAEARAANTVRFIIGAAQGEWVAVCPEEPSTCRALAPLLAAHARVPAIAVGLVDDEAVWWTAFSASGDAVDEYHSCPDYEKEADEDDADDAEVERTRGDASALKALGALKTDLLAEAMQEARIDRLRDHDTYKEVRPAEDVMKALRVALKLPELADFDDRLDDLGSDAHPLVYEKPQDERRLKLPKLPGLPSLPWRKKKTDDDDEDEDEADEEQAEAKSPKVEVKPKKPDAKPDKSKKIDPKLAKADAKARKKADDEDADDDDLEEVDDADDDDAPPPPKKKR